MTNSAHDQSRKRKLLKSLAPCPRTGLFIVKRALFIISALLLPQQALAWERAQEITVTPWYQGMATTAEFRKRLFDFSPGPPLRDVRLKASKVFGSSFSTEDCGQIGQNLINTKLDGLNMLRLPGRTFGDRPVYFAHNRFFLVSIDPAVVVVLPHRFSTTRVPAGVGNDFLSEIRSQYHALFEHERKVGIKALITSLENPLWFNYLELSPVVPETKSIQVISDLWDHPVSLRDAQADIRWPFQVVESTRFAGYLEFTPRPESSN